MRTGCPHPLPDSDNGRTPALMALCRCRDEKSTVTAKAIPPADCVLLDQRTVAALRGHADLAETMRRFTDALQDGVFHQPVSCDTKDSLRHQKVLLRTDTYLVLQIIWKESPFITDEELSAAGLAREFGCGALTCRALGVRLAVTKEEVGRSNTRVRTIIEAAEIYDLVSRDTQLSKYRPIVGTSLLHGVMVDIVQPLLSNPITPVIAVKGLEAR